MSDRNLKLVPRPPSASQPGHRDICAYLFQICGEAQKELLDARGIVCLFDVDSGPFPTEQCVTMGGILQLWFKEICTIARNGGRLTVALRRTAHSWILAVTDADIRPVGDDKYVGKDPAVAALASSLNASYRVRCADGGVTSAVIFVARAGQRGPGEMRLLLAGDVRESLTA